MHGIDFIQDLAVVMLVAGLVGWLCHRLGLSAVVGYLLAGMVIGPYTPPFALVTNVVRVETLAQLGLVFLMFSIGMKLSLRKLRRLGLALVVATVVGAAVMYNFARLLGAVLGWGSVQTAFLAGMLMVSSSAIISKVVQEAGGTHDKAGQFAVGVSVLEDVVAVVMLAVLNSLVKASGPATSLGGTLGLLGAFVALAGVGGLLGVPWLLRRLSLKGSEELTTILTAGLLFMLAVLAQKAGFSLALGAFLLGAIVAETPHRTQLDRAFDGMRDLFSAVFFVAIGMLIDVKAAAHLWWLALLLAGVTIAGRTVAVSAGLMVTGARVREAVPVGLSVTPLGEFTFIIAQLGIAAGVLAPEFQAVAVGVVLLTTLFAPVLVRRAPQLGEGLERRLPHWLDTWLESYRGWLGRLMQRQKRNLLWQISRRRLAQIFVEALVVTGLLVFADDLLVALGRFLPGEKLFPAAPRVVFWSGLTLVVLGPLVAIWRNISTLALACAEVATTGLKEGARLQPLVETVLKVAAGAVLFVWLNAVVPAGAMGRWLPLFTLALAVAAVVFARRRLVYWHSVVEAELQERLAQAGPRLSGTAMPWLTQHREWALGLTECVLPDQADVRGRTLGELGLRAKFGVVVAGLERQGVTVGNPGPETALYPRDKVLLLGDPRHCHAAREFLHAVTGAAAPSSFEEVRLESVPVAAASGIAGRTLAELAPVHRCGVQVAGIRRGEQRLLNPGGDEKLLGGDDVLVLGRPDQIALFRAWVGEE